MNKYKIKYERYDNNKTLIDAVEYIEKGSTDEKIEDKARAWIPLRESRNKEVYSMKIISITKLIPVN